MGVCPGYLSERTVFGNYGKAFRQPCRDAESTIDDYCGCSEMNAVSFLRVQKEINSVIGIRIGNSAEFVGSNVSDKRRHLLDDARVSGIKTVFLTDRLNGGTGRFGQFCIVRMSILTVGNFFFAYGCFDIGKRNGINRIEKSTPIGSAAAGGDKRIGNGSSKRIIGQKQAGIGMLRIDLKITAGSV